MKPTYTADEKKIINYLRNRARKPAVRTFPKFVDCTPTTAQYVERFCKLNHLTTGEPK